MTVPEPRFRFRIVHLAFVWLALLFLVVTVVRFSGADPYVNDYSALSQSPSASHLFGTDNLGRDMFARTMHGSVSSATVALFTVLLGGGVGISIGILAGYFQGSWLDSLIGFFNDLAMAVPVMVLLSVVVALRGPSLVVIGLTMGVFSIPMFMKMSRSVTLSIAQENYVIQARTLGAGVSRILFRELLPNVLPLMVPFVLTSIAGAVVAEGALSFLGFGLQPPEPSWGNLIAEGRSQLVQAPWVTGLPAITLCLTLLSINLIGEDLRQRGGKR